MHFTIMASGDLSQDERMEDSTKVMEICASLSMYGEKLTFQTYLLLYDGMNLLFVNLKHAYHQCRCLNLRFSAHNRAATDSVPHFK